MSKKRFAAPRMSHRFRICFFDNGSTQYEVLENLTQHVQSAKIEMDSIQNGKFEVELGITHELNFTELQNLLESINEISYQLLESGTGDDYYIYDSIDMSVIALREIGMDASYAHTEPLTLKVVWAISLIKEE